MLQPVDTTVRASRDGPAAAILPIVVGVLGSTCSSASDPAAVWAEREGAARHCPVRVVDLRDRLAPPAATLLGQAVGAALVVVGTSMMADVLDRPDGSAPSIVAQRSSCPVVVVNGPGDVAVRRVLVGVDGSDAGGAALEWATDEADLHGVDLVVVHAWQRTEGAGRSARGDESNRADAGCILDRVTVGASPASCHIDGWLREGEPARVLVDASEPSDLLVIGSRSSGYATMRFGSIARSVMEQAMCTVVAVHPRVRTDRRPSCDR